MPTTKSDLLQVEQDKEFLLHAPESSIFMACCLMLNELSALARTFKGGELSQNAFLDKSQAVLARLTETAAATERFDVVLPVAEHGRFSPFFWRWFNWWDDYFKGLTPGEIGQIERLTRERRPDVDDHRPKNDWLRYRHTPGFTLVIG